MALGLAICHQAEASTSYTQAPQLVQRRETGVSEFDVELYRYSIDQGTCRISPSIVAQSAALHLPLPRPPALTRNSTSSTGTEPLTPDELGSPQATPIIAAQFERRSNGGVKPRTLTAGEEMARAVGRTSKPRVAGVFEPLSPPASDKRPSRMSIGALGRSLRKSIAFGRASPSSPTPSSPSPSQASNRHRTSAATPTSAGSMLSPLASPTTAPLQTAQAAAHALIAANRAQARSGATPPPKQPASAQPMSTLRPQTSGLAPQPPQGLAQKRPRTAPEPETTKLLPQACDQAPRHLTPTHGQLDQFPRSEPMKPATFINPWQSTEVQKPRSLLDVPRPTSPCGQTRELPLLELSRSSSPVIVAASRAASSRSPSPMLTAAPILDPGPPDIVAPLDWSREARSIMGRRRSSSVDGTSFAPASRKVSALPRRGTWGEAEIVWMGSARQAMEVDTMEDDDVVFPSTPSDDGILTLGERSTGEHGRREFFIYREGRLSNASSALQSGGALKSPVRERLESLQNKLEASLAFDGNDETV